MGSVPGYEGAFVNAGHNCWGESVVGQCLLRQVYGIAIGTSEVSHFCANSVKVSLGLPPAARQSLN